MALPDEDFPLFPPAGEKAVVVSVSIPLDLRDQISDISSELGISRSAFVTAILSPQCSDLEEMISEFGWHRDPISPVGTPSESARRMRGSSVESVQATLADMFKLLRAYRESHDDV